MTRYHYKIELYDENGELKKTKFLKNYDHIKELYGEMSRTTVWRLCQGMRSRKNPNLKIERVNYHRELGEYLNEIN